MQNYIQKGENITLDSPADVLSGAGVSTSLVDSPALVNRGGGGGRVVAAGVCSASAATSGPPPPPPPPSTISTSPPRSDSGGYKRPGFARFIALSASLSAPSAQSSSCELHANGSIASAAAKCAAAQRVRPESLHSTPRRWCPHAPLGTRIAAIACAGDIVRVSANRSSPDSAASASDGLSSLTQHNARR